jgi:hypothetical protein
MSGLAVYVRFALFAAWLFAGFLLGLVFDPEDGGDISS